MSKPKSKKSKPKQTAAPKARTHIKVMVVHAKTREVLEGAEVTVTSVTPEEEKPQHGKTEKDKGYRTKKPVRPGDKTIIVKIDGFGPVVTTPSSSTAPAPLPTVGPVTQTVTIGASDGAEKIVKFNPPELQYFFEPNAKSGKGSYNAGGNRKAGENLVARQVLKLPRDKALRDAWNRPSPYPGVSAAVTEADIRECDFYKYRGHGLIQVTWHNNYDTPQFVAALATQGFTGLDACPTATMDRLLATTPAVYLALVYGWLFGRSKAFRAVNKRDWEALHTAVNAHSSHYHSYAEHCEAMIEAMIAAGPLLDPAMAP